MSDLGKKDVHWGCSDEALMASKYGGRIDDWNYPEKNLSKESAG